VWGNFGVYAVVNQALYWESGTPVETASVYSKDSKGTVKPDGQSVKACKEAAQNVR